jgi:hypothetical protein
MIACRICKDTIGLLLGIKPTYRVESTSKLKRSCLLKILTFEKNFDLFGSLLISEVLILSGKFGKLLIDCLRGHDVGIVCITLEIFSCR